MDEWSSTLLAEPPKEESWGETLLSSLEEHDDRTTGGYIGETAKAAVRGLGRGLLEAPPKIAAAGLSAIDDAVMAFAGPTFGGGDPRALPNLSKEELDQIRGSMRTELDDPEGTLPAQLAYRLGEGGRRVAESVAPVDPRYAGTLPVEVGEAVGRAVPYVAAYAAAPPLALMAGVGDAAVGAYERARRSGASEDKAKAAGYLTAPAGLLEAFGAERTAGKLIRRIDEATGGALWRVVSGVGRSLVGGAREAGEELAQALVEEGVAEAIYEDKTVNERLSDVLRQTEVGGAAGTVLTGIALAIAGVKRRNVSHVPQTQPSDVPESETAPLPDEGETEQPAVLGRPRTEDSGTLTGFQEPPKFVRLKKESATDPAAVREFVQQNPEIAEAIASAEVPSRTIIGQAVQGNLSAEQRAAFQQAVLEELTGPPAEVQSQAKDEPATALPQQPVQPVEPSTAPVFGQAAGTVQLGAISSSMRRGYDAIKTLARQLGTARGDLPKEVYELDVQRRRNINEVLAKGTFIERDFEAAMKQEFGDLAKDERTRATIDAALKDPAQLAALPPDLQDAARKVRDHVDILSRRGINEGVFDSELVPTIQANEGVYLHRQYRVFDDPEWTKKVDPAIRNRFKSWLAAEYPNDTNEQLEQRINNLLYEGKAAQGPIAFLKSSKLGAKDLSILKGRTLDDFPELRALYGEYSDPMVNYATSVVKMANLIENHHFLESVRREGLGKFLFEQSDPRIDPKASVRIAAESSDALHPLNGLFTYPEVEKAFREAIARQPESHWWVKQYIKANIATKIAKTAFSHATQLRNLLGYATMLPAQGYWRVGKAYDTFRVLLEDLGITANDKWRTAILSATKHGILRQGVQAGDLREMLADLKNSGMSFDEAMGGWPVRAAKKTGRLALKLYSLGDDGPRFFAWLNEIERYRKAQPGWSQQQLEENAAKIVNAVLPTYEGLPKIIDKLRYFPGGNTFLSFPAAMVKAVYNTLKQSFKELGDPATRGIGAQRLAGFMAAKVAPKAAALGVAAMLGMDDKDEEAVRKLLPPWDENGTLLWLEKPTAENKWSPSYVNLSSMDPYGMFDRAVTAGLRGENIGDAFARGAAEFLGNFIGEQVVFSKIVDVLRNTKGDTGGRVYNPTDDADEIFGAVAQHVGESVIPGTISSATRLGKAVAGVETEKGRVYDPTTETIAQFGIRASKVNLQTSLLHRAREYLTNKGLSENQYTSKLFAAGPVEDADLEAAQEDAEKSRRRYFDEMHEAVVGLQGIGIPEGDIRKVLKAAGVSEQHRNELIDGNYRPYKPSKQGVTRRTRQLGVTNPEAVDRVRERLRR